MYKNILTSTLPLVLTIVLFLAVGSYGIGRVQDLRSQITQVGRDKATLAQKLDTLQSIGAIVGTGSQTATTALPDKNPVLIVFTQVKKVAAQNTVTLTNLKSGAETKETSGISGVDISFDAAGSRNGIIAFLDGIQKTSPISLVDKVKLTDGGDSTRATVTVKTFWAAFPKSLPPVTQKISDLTADEKNTLDVVSAFDQPQFVDLPANTEDTLRANPFAP